MMPTNPERKGMDITPTMVIAESLRKKACNLPNVESTLNSKHNDTSNKHIADSLNVFVNVYKSLEDTTMSIAEKHLASTAKCI
jgi:hypothetical protein